jgi:hypothetical protein
MDKQILNLLEGIKSGIVSIENAYQYLKKLPYEDIGHTKVDHHRLIRQGVPEVIFGFGKTTEQIIEIAQRMITRSHNILVTRINENVFNELKKLNPEFCFNELGRCAYLEIEPVEIKGGTIAVVCAGTSDLPVVEEACTTLKILGNKYVRVTDVGVAGIHRLFDKKEILDNSSVIIVCAGMEGALASVIGGLVDKVVIAVPTSVGYGASFGGVSALLTMLNSCVPSVVTVNIDNGFGAAYSASLINRKI